MIPAAIFELGERVRVVPSCPIDFEGIGPLPGDVGEVVLPPERGDDRNYTVVRFERLSAHWRIPGHYLERTGGMSPIDADH